MFFVKKMRESFCTAKAFHIFSTKNIGISEILMFEILRSRDLTTSLVLNNRPQVSISLLQDISSLSYKEVKCRRFTCILCVQTLLFDIQRKPCSCLLISSLSGETRNIVGTVRLAEPV